MVKIRQYVTLKIKEKYTLLYIFFIIILIIISIIDIKKRTVPNILILVLLLPTLVYNIFCDNQILFALAITLPFILLYYLTNSIGGGDVKLIFVSSLLLGFQQMVYAIILSFFLSAVFSIILIILKKATKKSTIPFAPFLSTGIITMLLLEFFS